MVKAVKEPKKPHAAKGKPPNHDLDKDSNVRGGTAAAATKKRQLFVLDNGLTPEHEAYARCRAYGMSQSESITFSTNARLTSQQAAADWEKNYPLLRSRINELSEEVTDRVIEAAALNKGWVIDRLKKVVERCMVAEPVMVFNKDTKEMEHTGEWVFDSTGANRALELLGKELGMFSTKIEHNHNHIMKLTDDQLRNQIAELSAELGMAVPAELLALPAPG